MKISALMIALCLSFFLISGCGEKVKEVKETMNAMKQATEMAKNANDWQTQANTKWDERRKKGDTLAMPFKKLQEFLPPSVAGYTSQEPEGEQINMMGYSVSSAKRRYTSAIPDGAEKSVEIEIYDYNLYTTAFMGFAFWLSGYSREDGNGYERSLNTGNNMIAALEKWEKNSKHAELTYIVAYRFIVTIRGNNQDNTDLIKNVAQSVNMNQMTSY